MRIRLLRALPAAVTAIVPAMLLAAACSSAPASAADPAAAKTEALKPASAAGLKTEKATFAGGCFWCMEPPFEKLDGVLSVTSGYTDGEKKNPTYEEVSGGGTGHTESVQIVFDPAKVSYEKLLDVYWHNVDPTVEDRQFCDRGTQYRTGIFTHDAEQKKVALESKAALEKSKPFKESIVTEIADATEFYPAEDYHQDYYKKNPVRYKYYRNGCGRDRRLQDLWGSSAAAH